MSTIKKIKKLEQERSALVNELLKEQIMVRGTFGEVYRKCGKPTCWCVKGEGHPYIRISWSENAQSKTKAIPKKDATWIKKVTENYRNFRKLRHNLVILDKKFKSLLDQFENEMIKKSKKRKNYL